MSRRVHHPHLPKADPRRYGLIADRGLCPTLRAGEAAGCACNGDCLRPMTKDEHGDAARQGLAMTDKPLKRVINGALPAGYVRAPTTRVTFTLLESDVAAIDRLRGGIDRSEVLRIAVGEWVAREMRRRGEEP